MKKAPFIFSGSLILLLAACSGEAVKDTEISSLPPADQQSSLISSSAGSSADISAGENSEQSSESELEELDSATAAELEKEETEEIDWSRVHLTKRQFRQYLNELNETLAEAAGEEENPLQLDSAKMLDDRTIELIIHNSDPSEFAEIATSFFSWAMDTMLRQLYIRSDYSNGKVQPQVIIKERDGSILSDHSDFIELPESDS